MNPQLIIEETIHHIGNAMEETIHRIENDLDEIKLDLKRDLRYFHHKLLHRQICSIFEQRVKIVCGWQDYSETFVDIIHAYRKLQHRSILRSNEWAMTVDEGRLFYHTMKKFFPNAFKSGTEIDFFRKISNIVSPCLWNGRRYEAYEDIEEEELLKKINGNMYLIVNSLIVTKNESDFQGRKLLQRIPLDTEDTECKYIFD
jgi:hypothetical protein